MIKKSIFIFFITLSLSLPLAGCIDGGSSSSISGMKLGDGLK